MSAVLVTPTFTEGLSATTHRWSGSKRILLSRLSGFEGAESYSPVMPPATRRSVAGPGLAKHAAEPQQRSILETTFRDATAICKHLNRAYGTLLMAMNRRCSVKVRSAIE